jgi:regulatory protein
MYTKPNSSLKARAIMWLAQREHSRSELRAKLLHHARAAIEAHATAAAGSQVSTDYAPATAASDLEARVEGLLDWLEAHHYLSRERFVESRVQARARRFGNVRIRMELAQHGVELAPDAALSLKQSELARAQAVWARKFDKVATDAATRAKQMRFLAGRGFSAEVIRRVLKGPDED